MVIPCQLVLLLERLFAMKMHNKLVMPDPRDRIETYRQALAYVEKDTRLLAYVLVLRRQVTYGTCRSIDEIILECACINPSIIPEDLYQDRLPKGSYLIPLLAALRKSRFVAPKFDYEECLEEFESFSLAAE